jgi:hypothetical protein
MVTPVLSARELAVLDVVDDGAPIRCRGESESPSDPPQKVFALPRSDWGLRDNRGLDWQPVPDMAPVAAHQSSTPS